MRYESFNEIVRPTGRIILFTAEERKEIEQYNIRAKKDWD
ncbi:hypothetical protein MmiHf6_13400 [Methanimicrococcus hongohii]|uniref:Uncharacterized protein n=1 Tax=Methanimicrococcus hongohii TaxID=3028295 RepID=A0AA96V270_9EURY|nr:hypothetical protein MmiHf6_13400 [Methanimicrococcus sp. Hf6]